MARLGGDEFAVILSSLGDQDLAKKVMNRIVEACGLPFVFENVRLNMGASVGLAFFPEDALELNKLIEFADLKMYEHKRARKVINLNV